MTFARLLRISRQRLFAVSRKDELDADLGRELSFHFEQLVKENIAEGMALMEARQAARRTLGNASLLEEECRDQRRMGWLHDVGQDAVYGLRMLRKNRGFTLLAIASLAVGIGGNAAIFGAISSVLQGRLPVSDAERLVVIRTFPLQNPSQSTQASIPDFLGWRARTTSFESMGISIANHADLDFERDGLPAERVDGQSVSSTLFKTLGVQPLLGRVFTDEENPLGVPSPFMVISYGFWQRRFGGDPSVLNTQIRINGYRFTIIGVMPQSFWYPLAETEFWTPVGINQYQLQGSARFFMVTARLKPGVSMERAQSEMDAVAGQLSREVPSLRGWAVRVQPLRDYLLGWTHAPLLMLGTTVSLVLLIACANVATLLLARGSARTAELSMRVALGASRGRILRQLLTESLLLSLIGGGLGVLLAGWGLHSFTALMPPPSGMRIGEISLSPQMVAVAVLLSVFAGLGFGLAPARAAFYLGAGKHYSRSGLRNVLVSTQIAVALVLLIASGLMANSLMRLVGSDLNFDPNGLLSLDFRLPVGQYMRNVGSFRGTPYSEVHPPYVELNRVYEQLCAIPGVETVAGSSFPPVDSLVLPTMGFTIEDRPAPATQADRAALNAVYFLVTPKFFSSMKTPILRGRDFTSADTEAAQWMAVVNETMARQFWPGEDPIGKHISLDVVAGERPREIVGVVRDIPLRRVAEPRPVIYTSFLQQSDKYQGPGGNMFGQMTFLIRTKGEPMNLLPAARRAIADVEPGRPLASIVVMNDLLGGPIQDRSRMVFLIATLAGVATLLAAIGVYGVMSYTVEQRTREIGVRMALGASVGEILKSVGTQALLLIASGVAAGLAGSFAITRFLSHQLWGVSPTDPATFGLVTLLLVLVALIACFVPARRALRVNPTVALRSD